MVKTISKVAVRHMCMHGVVIIHRKVLAMYMYFLYKSLVRVGRDVHMYATQNYYNVLKA